MLRFSALFCAALLGLNLSSPAVAAAPPPYGHWRTTPPSEELIVSNDNSCGFYYMGKLSVGGTCYWDPTSAGGILTIVYPMPLEPGKVRFSIVWVNSKTIKLQGDVMHKVP